MSKKALTLIEVLMSIFIVALGIGAIFTVYHRLFEGVNLTSEKVVVWEIAQQEVEILRSTPFVNLFAVSYDPGTASPVINVFVPGIPNSSGVFYVEQLYGDPNDTGVDQVLNDLVRIEVVVCFQVGRRVVGEDTNLNGVLDMGEDLDGDGKISSPVTLSTLVLDTS